MIYTDGSSRGNPGPGGWGAIVVDHENSLIKELGGREENTTNNRMEMTAVIEGLKGTIENSLVEIHADSEYVIKGATEWIHNWQKNNWRTKAKKDVLNKDLWLALLKEMGVRKVSWNKVLGHSGHRENERCDQIATSFADNASINLYEGPESGYKIT